MALKARVASLEEVPEALRTEYTENNGEFVLAVEGMAPKEKVEEFRSNNVKLMKQIEDLNKTYEGVDPAVYREMVEKAQREQNKKLVDQGKVDELLANQKNAMASDHEKVVKALSEDKIKLTSQLESLLIDSAIRDAAAKTGVRGSAVEDVMLRGRAVFRLEDGKAIPKDGDKPIYGKSGDPMSVSEWVESLTEKAPHLFEPSKGGGSRQAEGTSAGSGTRISRGDQKAFLANLDAIKSGKVTVS